MRFLQAILALSMIAGFAASPVRASAAPSFEEQALRLRESVLLRVEPRLPRPAQSASRLGNSRRYPWKNNIITTVFWVGEQPTKNNPVPNCKSSWDVN